MAGPEQRGSGERDPRTRTPGSLVPGLLCLALAVGSAAALVAAGLGRVALPGCGLDSGCARAAASAWGSLPWLGWSTAGLGLSWASALAAAWWSARGRLPSRLRGLLGLGLGASVALVVAMLAGGYLCPWCLAFHAGHVAFGIVALREPPAPAAAGRRAWHGLLGVGTVALVAVVLLERSAVRRERDAAERALEASTERVLAEAGRRGFTGRYLAGPEDAPIRIVVISDYQCPDCRQMESQVRRLLRERNDVSFSAKHFPFCSDCNERLRSLGLNRHTTARRAARAAEAAGILGGDAAFQRMHEWLFDQEGTFDDSELALQVERLGLEAQAFTDVMGGAETLRRIQEDVAESLELGLHFTPLVFVNGVELEGWNAPDALLRTVERVAAAGAEAGSAVDDRPPSALEKFVADWRRQPRRVLPEEERHHWFGEPAAPVEVVVWGDYQEESTVELDGRIRRALEGRTDVRYSFRSFPFDQSCNEKVPRTKHPAACLAARAAEAAARMGGEEAHRELHAWLMEHVEGLDEAGLRAAALELGLDPEGLSITMGTPAVADAIAEDARVGWALGLRSIPYLFVDGRHVPRWDLEGEPVLERIFDRAASGR